MQEYLAKGAGTGAAKTPCGWAPIPKPIKSECTCTTVRLWTADMFKAELTGQMPGLGAYNGLGIYGFDNVSQKFTSTMIDNQGTGIMNGTGELSPTAKS